DGGLGDRRVTDQSALDFHRPNAVPGHIENVVDAAHEPEVAIFVAPGPVTGEIHAGKPCPVRRDVAIGIAPDRAHHRRPRTPQHEIAATPQAYAVPLLVHDVRLHTRKRERGRARVEGGQAG